MYLALISSSVQSHRYNVPEMLKPILNFDSSTDLYYRDNQQIISVRNASGRLLKL